MTDGYETQQTSQQGRCQSGNGERLCVGRRRASGVGTKPSEMPGFSLYMVVQVMVMMPTLLPNAPNSVKRRYRARIMLVFAPGSSLPLD
jgi:hypothetical protein